MLSRAKVAPIVQIQLWPIDRFVPYIRHLRRNAAAVDRMCRIANLSGNHPTESCPRAYSSVPGSGVKIKRFAASTPYSSAVRATMPPRSVSISQAGADPAHLGEQWRILDESTSRPCLLGLCQDGFGQLVALTGGGRALNPPGTLFFVSPELLERCAQEHFLHLTFGKRGEHIGNAHHRQPARQVVSNQVLYLFGIISGILTAHCCQSSLQDLALGSADVQPQYIDYLGREKGRKLLLEEWNHHLVAGKHDVLNPLLAHHPIENLQYLLGMVLVIVLRMPLIACLRPAGRLSTAHLRALDPVFGDGASQTEHEQASGFSVRDDRRVARELSGDEVQRVEMHHLRRPG